MSRIVSVRDCKTTNQGQIDIHLLMQTICVQKMRQATPVTLASVTIHHAPQHPRLHVRIVWPVLGLKREKFACVQLNARTALFFALIIRRRGGHRPRDEG